MMLATAESCTGGWIAEAVTMVPGSSEWFERGFVTYTYISKREMLDVKETTLERDGAVSEAVVLEMVEGAPANSHAQVAVAVPSGVAGPERRHARQTRRYRLDHLARDTEAAPPRRGNASGLTAIGKRCGGSRSSTR